MSLKLLCKVDLRVTSICQLRPCTSRFKLGPLAVQFVFDGLLALAIIINFARIIFLTISNLFKTVFSWWKSSNFSRFGTFNGMVAFRISHSLFMRSLSCLSLARLTLRMRNGGWALMGYILNGVCSLWLNGCLLFLLFLHAVVSFELIQWHNIKYYIRYKNTCICEPNMQQISINELYPLYFKLLYF